MARTRFILLALLAAAAPLAAAPDPFWETDWKAAKRRAAAEQRPILLDFAADWCGPCKRMDAQFWPLAEVRAATDRFVRVRFDFDRPHEMTRRLRIHAIPAVIVLDPWANPLTGSIGFGDTSELLDMFLSVPDDFAPLAADSSAAAAGKASGSALFRLGELYLRIGFAVGSKEFFEAAVKSKELKAQPRQRADAFVAIGLNHLTLGQNDEARKAFERAFDIEGGPERADEGLFGLVSAWCRLGKPDRAREALARLDREFPAAATTSAGHRLVESSCSG